MIPPFLHRFFFRPIDARGFGLLRMGWAAVALFFLLLQWKNISLFYSDAGLLPMEHLHIVSRYANRFSVLDYITDPGSVFAVYLCLLGALTFMLLGIWPRLTTLCSVLLLFSFQERNILLLTGGDTVLRVVGFILMIAPRIDAFSVKRLGAQWRHWQKTQTLLPAATMSIWPYRLLLWQLIVLYSTSAWDKLMGEMWQWGSAAAVALHHPHFARFGERVMTPLSMLSPFISWYTLVFELVWLLLLVPTPLWNRLPLMGRLPLKRIIIGMGILFHGAIAVLMDVGPFPYILIISYIGLLIDEDWSALRNWFNRCWTGKIIILNDFTCRLCRRSAFAVAMLDFFGRTTSVDYHDTKMKKQYAPDIPLKKLDHAMHIVQPDGSIASGYHAFKRLVRHLPLLWWSLPLFYVPGSTFLGTRIYAFVAKRRKKCIDGACRV